MNRIVDVLATPDEVLDLAIRVINYHAGSVTERSDLAVGGAFRSEGDADHYRISQLKVDTSSISPARTRVQVAWADGDSEVAARTLFEGLAPHVAKAASPASPLHQGATERTSRIIQPETDSVIPAAAKRYCTQCGAAVFSVAAAFCTQCGARLSNHDESFRSAIHMAPDSQQLRRQPLAATTPVGADHTTNPQLEAPGWEVATVIDEPEPEHVSAYLEVSGDTKVSLPATCNEGFVVGRDPRAASWVPDDPRISRRHFRITHTGDGYAIEDLASSNGTYLNGSFVREPQRLADGDIIEAGHLRAVFRDGKPRDADIS